MRLTLHNRSLRLRLMIIMGAASLPLMIAAALTADLWVPHLQPGVLATIGMSFILGQALVILAAGPVIGTVRTSPATSPNTAPANPLPPLHPVPQVATPSFKIDNLFQTFMDHIPALVIIKDHDGRYLYANSTIKEMLGKDPQDVMGRRDEDIWPEDVAEYIKEIDNMVLETRQAINTTGKISLDGEDRHLMINKFPIQHYRQGALLGGILFDITAKIRAEESKTQLEQQLIQSQKMEAIGTLAGGIAHDFNNILAAIFGYVELTRMDLKDNPKAERQLDQVLQASQRAKELVHQILAFSRKQDQERQPLDLAPLIKETIKLMRASLPASIEIHHRLDAKDTLVMADATQIHQVIMNLSTNAAHAMEAKGGRLTISLNTVAVASPGDARTHGVPPGTYLEICVQDTGYGISPSQIKRIFEPYYTTKPQGKGTGMGLAVVHGIVSSHGGTISAQSRPGQGSAFRILLPTTTQKDQALKIKDQPLPCGHESILFVDDEEYLADVCHGMLTRLGYKVTSCTDPREALEKIKTGAGEFDLLITDMTMPHITGDILAKEAMNIRPDLPIILCTGYSEQITPEIAARLGIASFLMKPITISDLACTLRGVLDPLSKRPGKSRPSPDSALPYGSLAANQ